jgi:hypothetical protein
MNIRHLKTLALIVLAATASFAIADPSGRVGRIAYVQGDVSFLNSSNDDSIAAQVNWPVTSQNLVATGRDGRAEIRVGSAAVRIDSDSELEVTQLDDDHFNLRLIYGSVYVRIKNPELAKDFALFTAQGRVLVPQPSRIRIDTERAPDTTSVSVLNGSANLASSESSFTVRVGKRAELSNGDVRMTTLRPNDMQDDFDRWAVARDQRDDRSQSVRYVSTETTGYEDLDQYGNWETTSEYGAVWAPRAVAADWAPYRVGRWTWVDPWGWTWVDSAPWGYAPFHYGRWVLFHQRWCWAPGTVIARPVWAPAMVGWVGGSNWNVSFSAGTAPAVGWFPLAPREVYVPSYRVSPAYIRQVNITHVTNVNNVTIVNGFASAPHNIHYRNREERNAVSLMPHDQFVAHRTVVVAADRERFRAPKTLENAPVSAVMPASIAHPHGFERDASRPHNVPPQPAAAERPTRFIQPVQPSLRETPPPTVRLPRPHDDVRIERPVAAPAAPVTPAPQLTAPPSVHAPRDGNREFNRGDERPTRHFESPNVLNPAREAPRAMPQPQLQPQPNAAQEATQRAQHDAQRQQAEAQARIQQDTQRQAEAQARALREQQNMRAPAVPLKQAAPTPAPVPAGQEERRHQGQEKAPAEMRREERPAGGRDGNEGGGRPGRRDNSERR